MKRRGVSFQLAKSDSKHLASKMLAPLAAFTKTDSPDGGLSRRQFHAHHAEVRFVIGDVDLCLSPDTAGLHRLFDALARFQIELESPRPPNSFGRKALAVLLTTSQRRSDWENGAGTRGTVRLVLIDDAGDSANRASLSQPRRQWERVCHDSLSK